MNAYGILFLALVLFLDQVQIAFIELKATKKIWEGLEDLIGFFISIALAYAITATLILLDLFV